jgi:hypothetical protein
MRSLPTLGFGMLCAVLIDTSAQAQIFISASGKDSNSCSRTAPCRTLQRGVNATGPGRELTILTSGEYGPATITKGMTILAEGVSANVRQFNVTNAITVNAPGQKVVLKGLLLTGGGTGGAGINVVDAAFVAIEHVEIEGFAAYGIVLNSSATVVSVSDTASRYNGAGLYACCDSSRLTVDGSRFENNADNGLDLRISGSITRSIVSDNGNDGVSFQQTGGSLTITKTTAANNGRHGFAAHDGQLTLNSAVARGNAAEGLFVPNEGAAWAILTSSVFTNNDVGVFSAGAVLTLGNNIVAGNTTAFQGGVPSLLNGY